MFCEFSPLTKAALNEHLKEEHNDAIFYCKNCLQYLPKYQLLSHMRTHVPEVQANSQKKLKRFPCDECEASFKTKRVLQNHVRSKHNPDSKRQYSCTVCNKNFKTDAALFTHLKLHEEHKPYKCATCNKSFRLRHHLQGHQVQHKVQNKDAQINCKRCCKTFPTKDHLRKHAKIHLLNDCTCHICGVKLKQQRYLQQHMLKVHLKRWTMKK